MLETCRKHHRIAEKSWFEEALSVFQHCFQATTRVMTLKEGVAFLNVLGSNKLSDKKNPKRFDIGNFLTEYGSCTLTLVLQSKMKL